MRKYGNLNPIFLTGKQRRLNEGAQRPKRLLKMLKTPRTLRLNTFKKNWNWTCLILLTASFHEFSKVNGRFDEFLKNFDMILLFT